MNQLSVSIVIPVYNEEHHIKACLDAIAAQTVQPLEVIVVDNNCTDKTIEIAKTYPFVKIIRESKQGRGPARDAGFNAVKGVIIGRIDGDSILTNNWVERVLQDFSRSDIDGVTGPGLTRVLIGVGAWYSTFWTETFFRCARIFYGTTTLWGANMAISTRIWQAIKTDVATNNSTLHEDQDLSLVLIGSGGRLRYDRNLNIRTMGGSYLYWPKFWDYLKRNFRTKRYHEERKTLRNVPKLKFAPKDALVVFLGVMFTGVFIVYSLICWPIIATLIYFDKDILEKKR